jgi:opacity protein-like surface antigen
MKNKFLKVNICIIYFSLIILVISTLNLYSLEIKARVIKEGAVLRLNPERESTAIKNLPLGAILEVEEIVGEWLKGKLPPDERGFVISGYVHKSFVTFEIEPVPAKPRKRIEQKEERRPAFGLGISGGYASPTERIYDGGAMFGGRICYSITKNIGVELKGLVYQSPVDGEPEGLSAGKMTFVPIQLSALVRFPLGKRIVPYVGFGAGYYLSSFEIDSEIVDDWEDLGFNIEEKVEHKLGYHFGLGMDYFFSNNLALNADFSYCLVESKGSWSITEQASGAQVSGDFGDLNFNTIMFGIGLTYFF